MAYTSINFKTKKALKEAVARGDAISVYQPGLGSVPTTGWCGVEGPHYPAPHTWYAQVQLKDRVIVAVK